MDLALDLARQGEGRTSPNPAVGAVIVRDGIIVGRGFHTWTGVDHAEIIALREAGDAAHGATVYLTLEPCSHHGRTPPCAEALVGARVSKVVAAMTDPNPEISGRGLERLRAAGVEVEFAPEYEDAATKLNEAFMHAMRKGRPLVTMKAAMTLDGKIAAGHGDTGWITSEQARAHVHRLRHASDAIVTGIGTVLADDPLLTDRTGLERSRPLLRVVLDSSLRIPLESRIIQSVKGDLLVVCGTDADMERKQKLETRGVRVLITDGTWTDLLADLSRDRIRSLLIESGATVNASALEAGVVDKIFFYYAPKIMGGLTSLPAVGGGGRSRDNAIRIERVTLHTIASDEFAVEGYVHRDR